MTDRQKEEFRNWLLRLVEAQKVIRDNKRTKIDGLDELAGHCECVYRVHLDRKAFAYAVEAFEPVIKEYIKNIDEKDIIFRHFEIDDVEIMALFYKEVNADE